MGAIESNPRQPFHNNKFAESKQDIKYEHHYIKNLTNSSNQITNCAEEVFEIPLAPTAPLPAAKVKIHPNATHLTDEVTTVFKTRIVANMKKIEELDAKATKKRLAAAHEEFHQERALGSMEHKIQEKEVGKEKTSHYTPNQQQRQTVKGKKKEKAAEKTAPQERAPTDSKVQERRSSLARFVEQTSEEKKERDLLNEKLEAKKEAIEEDQQKINNRFKKQTHRD